MVKTLVVAGASVAAGVIVGDMIDAKLGPKIAGADGKRETLRRGVRIATQTGLAVVLFSVASKLA